MDVVRIAQSVMRRWYVVAVVLALAFVGVRASGWSSVAEYKVSMSWLTTPPVDTKNPPNPLGSAEQASEAVVAIINSREVRQYFSQAGLATAFEAKSLERNAIVNVAVSAENAALAERTGRELTKYIQDRLSRLQLSLGFSPTESVKVLILDGAGVDDIGYSSSRKAQAVTAFVSLVLGVVAAIMVDNLVAHVRRRRAAAGDAP